MVFFRPHAMTNCRLSIGSSKLALIALAVMIGSPLWADEPAATPAQVRVMSFNIRYGTARDGENHWNRRRSFVVDTIKSFNPDLLGTQETLDFQRDFLAGELPAYDHLGVGRDDGAERGEMMALYYDRERFEKLDGGHFWLSDTPDKPGSKSWDSSLPRMVTWVKLRDRRDEAPRPITFFNTHFDHAGPTARLESAKLLRERVAAAAKDSACIVTGDFNAGEASAPYRALFEPIDGSDSPIADTFRKLHKPADNEGTFSGFSAKSTGGERIDWIGATSDWEILSAGIDRTAIDGRTPSDHFPVNADLRRK
jgi:endonuclease/exonuclease/phosphatase family metal-dependent hydrolase